MLGAERRDAEASDPMLIEREMLSSGGFRNGPWNITIDLAVIAPALVLSSRNNVADSGWLIGDCAKEEASLVGSRLSPTCRKLGQVYVDQS